MTELAEPHIAHATERHLIDRPRLLRQLDTAETRTILLVAPAGYGKTTLAQQWMRSHKAGAWYTATNGARDVIVLTREIANAVTSALGSSATHFGEFLKTIDNPRRDGRRVVDTLTEAIVCSGLTHLCIDDYQTLSGSPEAEEAIDLLRRRTPLQLIVTSRHRPSWATARALIYGEMCELGRDDLAMTSDESTSLLRGARSAGLAGVAQQARGWPAVLGLAALAQGAQPPEGALPSALYDFFAEELLQSAEPWIQDALVTLALLPTLTPRLLERAFAERTAIMLEEAQHLGALCLVQERYELHPLFRDFLIAKLCSTSAAEARAREAVELALETSSWDTAMSLIKRFELSDLVESVWCRSYLPLLNSGRISTLAQFAMDARARSLGHFPSMDLIAADIALRDENHLGAEEVALRVARQLGMSHPLLSHAYSVGGRAAFASWQRDRADDHFRSARRSAVTEHDAGAATWGIALAAMYGNSDHLADAVEDLKARRDRSPVDLVRYAQAQLALARLGTGVTAVPELEDALHVARNLDDPHTRTSFSTAYSYYKGLQSHYGEALVVARETLHDAQAFGLSFVVPHARWNIAFSLLGMRQFAQADKALQHVEIYARTTENFYHALNARCLRARFLLSLNQVERALEEVSDHSLPIPTAEMWQEYLGTRALVHAIACQDSVAVSCAESASQVGAPAEARALAAMARAVIAAREGDLVGVATGIAGCADLGTWDPLVCAVRSYPPLLALALEDDSSKSLIARVLSRSHDVVLARGVGIRVKRAPSPASALLSPREREVLELIKNGLTNREIGSALFISEATAKVHVHHVMEKLQVKTRTAAATRIVD